MVRIDRDVMPAVAVNQQAGQTHLAHLAEGDFQRAAVGMRRCRAWRSWHGATEARRGRESTFRANQRPAIFRISRKRRNRVPPDIRALNSSNLRVHLPEVHYQCLTCECAGSLIRPMRHDQGEIDQLARMERICRVLAGESALPSERAGLLERAAN